MRKFFEILRFLKPYKGHVALNLFYNLLNAIFSVVSFSAIIPFIKMLFETAEKTNDEPVKFIVYSRTTSMVVNISYAHLETRRMSIILYVMSSSFLQCLLRFVFVVGIVLAFYSLYSNTYYCIY